MEIGIGIVAISQLSRGEKNVRRRPVLSDLKESSSIEQDANLVAFLHGEWQETEMDWYPWEVIVAKRRGGPCGTIGNEWRKETGTFRER
jgi:replicative DNA helicase